LLSLAQRKGDRIPSRESNTTKSGARFERLALLYGKRARRKITGKVAFRGAPAEGWR
jgi:hypothetical protein